MFLNGLSTVVRALTIEKKRFGVLTEPLQSAYEAALALSYLIFDAQPSERVEALFVKTPLSSLNDKEKRASIIDINFIVSVTRAEAFRDGRRAVLFDLSNELASIADKNDSEKVELIRSFINVGKVFDAEQKKPILSVVSKNDGA